MYRLAVIIVNYRTPDLVLKGLASLDIELAGGEDCAIIVDNQSDDDSVPRLEKEIANRGWSDWVTVIAAQENRGFSAGNNIGINTVAARYYLLLNSDAYVRKGAVARLLATAEANPEAGVVAPRLEWPNGEAQISCFRAHSPLSELVSAARTSQITALFPRVGVPLPVADEPTNPEWVSFACALIRGETIREVGALDEGYFMFFEDADFCGRARAAGWSVRYEPTARVVHLRGGTSPVKTAQAALERLPRYWYASRSRYFRKFYGRYGLWLANLAWYAGRSVSLARELVGHKQRHVCDAKWRDIWIDDYQPPAG